MLIQAIATMLPVFSQGLLTSTTEVPSGLGYSITIALTVYGS